MHIVTSLVVVPWIVQSAADHDVPLLPPECHRCRNRRTYPAHEVYPKGAQSRREKERTGTRGKENGVRGGLLFELFYVLLINKMK